MSGMWPSPHPLASYSDEQYRNGLVMAAQGWELVERNPQMFRDMVSYVRTLQLAERRGHLRARVVEHMMHLGYRMDEQFRFNNSRWAALARYMVLHDPTLESPTGPVSFRKSDIDACGLYPVSWMEVADGVS